MFYLWLEVDGIVHLRFVRGEDACAVACSSWYDTYKVVPRVRKVA